MSQYWGPIERNIEGGQFGTEALIAKTLKEKDAEIDRLKGLGAEKDAEICELIREKILTETPVTAGEDQLTSEDIYQLTAALLNMRNVMEDRK